MAVLDHGQYGSKVPLSSWSASGVILPLDQRLAAASALEPSVAWCPSLQRPLPMPISAGSLAAGDCSGYRCRMAASDRFLVPSGLLRRAAVLVDCLMALAIHAVTCVRSAGV